MSTRADLLPLVLMDRMRNRVPLPLCIVGGFLEVSKGTSQNVTWCLTRQTVACDHRLAILAGRMPVQEARLGCVLNATHPDWLLRSILIRLTC